MPSLIQILPENLCNQIAAGEVVERPASVVKELLENALDAGADEIQVEVEKGGKRLIRVSDNGSGMGREDLLLCLERHATSKIRTDKDLFALTSLGFRGEALPSIAAVSRTKLRSRTGQSDQGWEVSVDAGRVVNVQAVGRPQGTEIEVCDLFHRMPARKKFLRREETEIGHIAETVTRQALSQPEVRFRLRHQGRSLLDLPRHSGLKERIGALLGRPILKHMQAVDQSLPWGRIHGEISSPALSRSSSQTTYTYINQRYIRDRVIQHAILEAYRGILPKGRYPILVLMLEIEPDLVDVNVHPTKHEVRFRNSGEVHDGLVNVLRETLRGADWLETAPDLPSVPTLALPVAPETFNEAPVAASSTPATVSSVRVREALQGYASSLPKLENQPLLRPVVAPKGSARQDEDNAEERCFFSGLRLIGQFRNSYLVCQEEDSLVLIDQHAAHERIGFERLKAELATTGIARQALLFPLVLELTAAEFAEFSEQLERLDRLGFEIEIFGQRAFAIKAVPQLLAGAEIETLLRDLASELTALGSSVLIEEALDKVLISMACHYMVRANQALGHEQMLELLRQLDAIDFRTQCPHGRPVSYLLSDVEIERLFKRR